MKIKYLVILQKQKKFIKDNLDLFSIQFSYPHIFSSSTFINEFKKYLQGKYKSKQELVDYLFRNNESEKPKI